MQIVDHGGIKTARLGRTADTGDAQQRVLVGLVQHLVGLPDRLAPQVGRGAQLGPVVLDVQVYRLRRPALEDHHVPAGIFHLGADEPTRIRAGHHAGQRALGDHRVTPPCGGHCAGQRAGRHDQLVFGTQRIALRIDLLRQVLGRQSALTEIFVRPRHVERFRCARALAEVDTQNLSGPGHISFSPILKPCRPGFARRIRASCPAPSSPHRCTRWPLWGRPWRTRGRHRTDRT